MAITTKSQSVVIGQRNALDTFTAIALLALKERSVVLYEYDLDTMPDVLAKYNKIPKHPCLIDKEVVMSGGVLPIVMYLDMKFPLPKILPGRLADFGHRLNLHTVIEERLCSIFNKYEKSNDMAELECDLVEIGKSIEEVFVTNIFGEICEPTLIEALFLALLFKMEEMGLDFVIFKNSTQLTIYLSSLFESSYYKTIKSTVINSRSSKPFWVKTS